MAQQDLIAPDSHYKLPTTAAENKESGESYKRTLDKITAMLTELYAGAMAAFSVAAAAVTVDRPLVLKSYTVATLPAVGAAGGIIYVSNGAAGSPIVAFSNGANWLRCDTAAAVAAA